MIKRIIFDVDGTLIVGCDFNNAIRKTLKKLNLYSNFNMEKFREAILTYEKNYNNYNYKDYIEHFSKCLNVNLNEKFIDIFFNELKECIPSNNEYIIETIEKLSLKYELVLLTNYFSASQMNRLNNMGIGNFFKECYGEQIIKPNNMAYLLACGNNKPCECLMIGDDLILDIKGAQNLGINTIWVNSKNIKNDFINTLTVYDIKEITKDYIVKNFEID